MIASAVKLPSTNPRYVIHGGTRLEGTLFVQGAKNAVLPMIAGALLPKRGRTVLRNVPPLNDVRISMALAQSVGATVTYYEDAGVLVIDSSSVVRHVLDSGLTRQSRASILFLSPVLHRLGKVDFRGIGGCSLGVRRLDFHHNGLKRLGAQVEGDHDQLMVTADELHGNLVYLDMPSQTSTENLMMAACMASGTTIIENAASEPEIVDFAAFLTKMGARLSGVGTRTIVVEGVRELNAVEHSVMPDRLDASAFMMAAAITKGDVMFVGAEVEHMRLLVAKLEQMGVEITSDGCMVRVRGPERLRPINVVTWPYPGFSTDFLPAIMTLATVANGVSYFRENVFEDRFTHVDGLNSLGAQIRKQTTNFAQVDGVERLHGGAVVAPDLRAGMAFVLAGLVADGETTIDNIYQIERGHGHAEARLQGLGGQITRVVKEADAGPRLTRVRKVG